MAERVGATLTTPPVAACDRDARVADAAPEGRASATGVADAPPRLTCTGSPEVPTTVGALPENVAAGGVWSLRVRLTTVPGAGLLPGPARVRLMTTGSACSGAIGDSTAAGAAATVAGADSACNASLISYPANNAAVNSKPISTGFGTFMWCLHSMMAVG